MQFGSCWDRKVSSNHWNNEIFRNLGKTGHSTSTGFFSQISSNPSKIQRILENLWRYSHVIQGNHQNFVLFGIPKKTRQRSSTNLIWKNSFIYCRTVDRTTRVWHFLLFQNFATKSELVERTTIEKERDPIQTTSQETTDKEEDFPDSPATTNPALPLYKEFLYRGIS
jgi:hypothetical protein